MRVFPTYLLRFDGKEIDIERRKISGGESLSGDETETITDGGGRVYAQFSDPLLDDPEIGAAWSALSDHLVDQPMIVPLSDIKHQFVGSIHVPPGGLPWWEESEYTAGQVTNATLAAAASLRATSIAISIAFQPQPLRAGSWLSIRHAAMGHRAYRIKRVVAQTASAATLELSHPLREAAAEGTRVELSDPLCVMKLQGAMTRPMQAGFPAPPAIRLVEDFRGAYS